MDPVLFITILKTSFPLLLAAGAAYGGAKQALNGTRERVNNIEDKLNKHITDYHVRQTSMFEGLARVDQKLTSFIEYNRKD